MGSGSGSAGQPERTSGQGRHRRDEAAPVWPTRESAKASTRSGTGRHSRPEVGPAANDRKPTETTEAEPDDPPDTGSAGLRMFNLGSIPASVTPPRSWRRAAWFTVVASVAALAGLLAVGAVLVCPPQQDRRLLALPYFPDGTPLASIGGGVGTPRSSANGTGRPVTVTADSDMAADTVGTAAVVTARRGGTRMASPSSAPVVVTLPSAVTTAVGGEPVVDPVALIKRTQTFFKEVTSNAKAAADLTSDTLHDDALALIHQKYGNISAIKVQSISLDPNSGLTVSVLRVVDKDGTTTTRRTTLQFTLTGDPKISNFGNP